MAIFKTIRAVADIPTSTAVILLLLSASLVGCREDSTSAAPTTAGVGKSQPDGAELPQVAVEDGPSEPTGGTAAAGDNDAVDAVEEVQQSTLDLSFDDIKFDMEKEEPFLRSMLTEKIQALANRKIRIRGYILPGFSQRGITQFVLVRDNMECCFGPGAALFDCILVDMTPNNSIDYTIRPVSVEGTFDIQEIIGPDQKHLAIYHLEADKVE